jgi:glucose/arabinose dehydrogenase
VRTGRAAQLGLAGIAVAAIAIGCAATTSRGDERDTAGASAGSTTAAATSAASTSAAGTSADTPAKAESNAAISGNGQNLRVVRIASGLSALTYLTALPGEPSRLFVVEQVGRIRIVEKGRVVGTFLDISDDVVSGGEQGLLSMAFHPDYASNRLFYVNYTDRSGDTRVVEYRAQNGGAPTRVREVLFVEQPYSNHNGGQLKFGPDGLLYVGMGDGGAGGDPEERAQNLGSRLGKLLRIDVDRSGAEWENAGYGLRNPWRFTFDRDTGDLYIGDVGESEWEEIDFLSRSRLGSLINYGWDVFEGNHQFENKEPSRSGQLMGPIFEYNHSQGCSVTGGYVYRGAKVRSARGRYFFGDYCSGRIWSLVVKDGKATKVKRHTFTVDALSSFGENARGELFLVTGDGEIYRLAQG